RAHVTPPTALRPRRFTGVLVVGALIAPWAGAGILASGHAPAAVVRAAPALSSVPVASGPVAGGYADVVAKVAPGVVTVRSQRAVKVADSDDSFPDPFEEFFGRRFRQMPQVPQAPPRERAL